MEVELIKTIAEAWTVYWLFIFIIIMFIWKWIPFMVKQFTSINDKFIIALQNQQLTFEQALKTISNDFMKKVEDSDKWHKSHSDTLNEIKEIVSKK